MKIPLRITFRHMRASKAVEDDIREKASKLDKFYDRITGCHVMVEAPHQRHHQGKLFHVRVDLTVPGKELVVRRDPTQHHAHESVYVAIRDAFNAARREIQDHVRRRFHRPRTQERPTRGQVSKLFPDEDYGFLETADGREIYFHRHSVLKGGFDRLQIGSRVRFTEEMGVKGPQASTVSTA